MKEEGKREAIVKPFKRASQDKELESLVEQDLEDYLRSLEDWEKNICIKKWQTKKSDHQN